MGKVCWGGGPSRITGKNFTQKLSSHREIRKILLEIFETFKILNDLLFARSDLVVLTSTV